MKAEVWEAYKKLGEQVAGKKEKPTVDDLVQQRRLGNTILVVVDFGALDGTVRSRANQFYDAYLQAREVSDQEAAKIAAHNFFESTGFLAVNVYNRAEAVRVQTNSPHPAARLDQIRP